MAIMYTPKKVKWNSLTEFRDFLMRETAEKIVVFDGWRLITETTEYGIIDGVLRISPKQKKVVEPKLETLGDRPKKPKVKKKLPEVKQKSKKEIIEEMRQRGKAALDKKKKAKR